ncbi:hypothetical protein [Hyphobacterium marinum]|nr:hypothetical protein [Hyphobacterium sp. Y6023]
MLAARLAVARAKVMSPQQFERWVRAAGPLPIDAVRRAAIVEAVRTGIEELSTFLDGFKWR